MWEEGALFFRASGVSKYFPPNTSVEALNKSSKSNTLATFPTNTNFLAPAPPPFAYAFAVLVIVAATATTTEYPFPYPPFPSSLTDFLPRISTRVLHHSNVDCALLLITTLLLAQNIKITTSNRKPNTNPIAIPAIAPPNNFLLLLLPLPFLSLRTLTFTGQESKGPPQSELPKHESFEKVCNLLGTNPWSNWKLGLFNEAIDHIGKSFLI